MSLSTILQACRTVLAVTLCIGMWDAAVSASFTGGAEATAATGYVYDSGIAATTPTTKRATNAVGVAPWDDGRARPSSSLIAASLATKGEENLLATARKARDAKAAEVGRSKATVTGGYDPSTGRVVAGCSRNPTGCAEDDIARQLGIPPDQIRFIEAIRPRTGRQVPVCARCQSKYGRSQFPPGTIFGTHP